MTRAEDIFAPLVQSLLTIEMRIGKIIEQYRCLVPFLSCVTGHLW